jgi:hypothetical protein
MAWPKKQHSAIYSTAIVLPLPFVDYGPVFDAWQPAQA